MILTIFHRYEKNWESTYRLTDTTPFYPYHFGSKTDFYLRIVENTRNTSQTPGHYRQMITEGKIANLPEYSFDWKKLKIPCSAVFVDGFSTHNSELFFYHFYNF